MINQNVWKVQRISGFDPYAKRFLRDKLDSIMVTQERLDVFRLLYDMLYFKQFSYKEEPPNA